MALLIQLDGHYHALASEGGHTDFAPSTESEWELKKFLGTRYGHVSNERLLSGSGLVHIYQWMLQKNNQAAPIDSQSSTYDQAPAKAITQAAIEMKNPLCVAALNLIVKILGTVAGNLALMGMTAGGIYLGGGIPPKILPALKEAADLFMKSFTDKGRFKKWMHTVPVKVITQDNP